MRTSLISNQLFGET